MNRHVAVFSRLSRGGLSPDVLPGGKKMKSITTVLLAAFVLGSVAPDVLARGGRGGGGGRHSYSSHSYKAPAKSRSGGGRRAPSGSYASDAQAGDGICHTGPRGGRYTITPSGRKNYNGC